MPIRIIHKNGVDATIHHEDEDVIFKAMKNPDDNLMAVWPDGEINMDCVASFWRVR